MRTIESLLLSALLFVATGGMAATVEYQNPNLTIVAKGEPLDVVLKSLGKEMRIYITIPTGLNPVVNCDIQQQPVKQAFKTLLGDMSYSMEWEEKTGQLVGVTILAGGGESAVAANSDRPSHGAIAEQATPVTVAGGGGQGVEAPVAHSEHETPPVAHADGLADRDTMMVEHEARMETERAEQEARMVEERAAQVERMKEELARHDVQHETELKAFLDAKGLAMPQ